MSLQQLIEELQAFGTTSPSFEQLEDFLNSGSSYIEKANQCQDSKLVDTYFNLADSLRLEAIYSEAKKVLTDGNLRNLQSACNVILDLFIPFVDCDEELACHNEMVKQILPLMSKENLPSEPQDDLSALRGQTIKDAYWAKKPPYDDEGYLVLEFSEGKKVLISASYGGYTGDSEDEYPTFIYVSESVDSNLQKVDSSNAIKY